MSYRPAGLLSVKVCPLETKAGIEGFAVKNRTPIRQQLDVRAEKTAAAYP